MMTRLLLSGIFNTFEKKIILQWQIIPQNKEVQNIVCISALVHICRGNIS